MRRIFVTRHGQPDLKKERKKINSGDSSLSPLGCTQATKLGKQLKALNFQGKIYVSPYVRTVETGVLIGKELGIPVYPEACIQERVSAGGGKSLEALPNLKKGGCSLAKLRKAFPGGIAEDAVLKDDWLYSKFEDWETVHVPRIAKGLKQLRDAQKEGDMLLVCHAGSVRALNQVMTPEGQKPLPGKGWNCCLFIYGEKADGSIVQIGFVEPEKYLDTSEITTNRIYKDGRVIEDAKKEKKTKKTKETKK